MTPESDGDSGDRARWSPLVFPTTRWRSDPFTWKKVGFFAWNELRWFSLIETFFQDLTDLEAAGLPLPTVNQIELGCRGFLKLSCWSPIFFSHPRGNLIGRPRDDVELRINPFLYRKKWGHLSEESNEINDHSNFFDCGITTVLFFFGKWPDFQRFTDWRHKEIYVENALPWSDGYITWTTGHPSWTSNSHPMPRTGPLRILRPRVSDFRPGVLQKIWMFFCWRKPSFRCEHLLWPEWNEWILGLSNVVASDSSPLWQQTLGEGSMTYLLLFSAHSSDATSLLSHDISSQFRKHIFLIDPNTPLDFKAYRALCNFGKAASLESEVCATRNTPPETNSSHSTWK